MLSRLSQHQGSAFHLSKDTFDTDGGDHQRDGFKSDDKKKPVKKDDVIMIKYLKTQVSIY